MLSRRAVGPRQHEAHDAQRGSPEPSMNHRTSPRVLGLCLAAAVLVVLVWRQPRHGQAMPQRPVPSPGLPETSSSPRLVYIPDVHGDFEQGVHALTRTGLVNKDLQWVGGSSILIQGGDIVDRGPGSMALVQLFSRLKAEAQAVGGQVVCLLGNHELMILSGDLRYFHPGEMRGLGGKAGLLAALAAGQFLGDTLRSRPLAHIAHWPTQQAEGGRSDGRVRPGPCDILFVHAAVTPSMLEWAQSLQREEAGGAMSDRLGDVTVAAWNLATHEGLASCVGRSCWKDMSPAAGALLGAEGGVWSRYYTTQPETEVCALIANVTQTLGVSRVVVGHTIQQGGRPRVRCAGRLVMADVGMSRGVGGALGHTAALTCDTGPEGQVRLSALHGGDQKELVDLEDPG